MFSTLRRDWRLVAIQSVGSAIVVLVLASALSAVSGQTELAERVDKNAAVAVTAADAIICILQLGVGEQAPPRNDETVRRCLVNSGYVDIPTVILEEVQDGGSP
jgi:hypothetical protein